MADWKIIIWTYVCVYVLHLFRAVSPLQCFYCPLSASHEECTHNSTVNECQVGTMTCSTQVKYKAGTRQVVQITRSCMADTFCIDEMARLQNKDCAINATAHYVCMTCCHSNLCNKLPSDDAERARGRHLTVHLAAAAAVLLTSALSGFGIPFS